MAHFAVLCPESPGHFNPMTTLLAELKTRGHQITWIGTLDGAERARRCGLDVIPLAHDRYPRGTLDQMLAELGTLSGFAAVRFSIDAFRQGNEVILDEAPQVIRDCGATALISDESVTAGRTVAELVNLPWISVCNALPLHPDPDQPPIVFGWKYGNTWWGRWRNHCGRKLGELLLRPIHRVVMQTRRKHGLSNYDLIHENASRLATIAQIPAEFDYPRREKPAWFHYVGGLHNVQSRPNVEFPFDRLDGRPLVYASLGTAQNRVYSVFRAIAEACRDPSLQVVISMGGGGTPEDLGELPGNPIVVAFAPQLKLLQRAKLVITHAGMNTTMESIAHGLPLVAIPITNDQPAVAARIAWTGCGEVVPIRRVTAGRIAAAVHRVLDHERYAEQARRLATANRRAGGVRLAADIIEQVSS